MALVVGDGWFDKTGIDGLMCWSGEEWLEGKS